MNNFRILILFAYLLLSTLLTVAYPAGLCVELFSKEKVISAETIEQRKQIIQRSYNFRDGAHLIQEMAKEGSLLYIGNHEYSPGTEFLASNEFDWAKKASPDR